MRGARFWVLHYMAGAILFIFLLSHIFTMHYETILSKLGLGVSDPLLWENVVERAKNLIFQFGYIVFLGFALFHGLYGLKNIITEISAGKKYSKVISYIFWIIGIFLFLYGTITTLKTGGF
jgi:succinate dehydrogenase hydrophobic anchor subunit